MRRQHRLLAVAIAFALALVAAPAATAQVTDQNQGSGNQEWWRSISAQQYLRQATQGYLFEIEISQLAQERGRFTRDRWRSAQWRDDSSEIRDLARDFEADYRRLLDDALRVARDLRIDVPRTLDPRLQDVVDRLERLRGNDFDRAWLRIQVFTTRELLLLNLRAAIRGDEDEIRTLAQSTLPVITDNLGDLLDVIDDFNNHRHDHGRFAVR